MKLSIITKHPLKDGYMLYCPVTAIPPYFGTLEKCKKAQEVFESKLHEQFDKLDESDKRGILNRLDSYRAEREG